MKNLFFTLAFFALSFSVKAQTTITVHGEATVTIDDKATTIKCDRFYQTTCMTITSPTPVIVKNFAEITAYRNNQPFFTKSGVVKSYDIKEGSNSSEHTFTFED